MADLELVIQGERRANHDSHFESQNLARKNQELKADLDRQKLRVQSL
jgi:hypothetical protein